MPIVSISNADGPRTSAPGLFSLLFFQRAEGLSSKPAMTSLFLVKCLSSSQVIYECEVESWEDAVLTAHLLAETYGHRANVYNPGEKHHAYSATGKPDITNRIFT